MEWTDGCPRGELGGCRGSKKALIWPHLGQRRHGTLPPTPRHRQDLANNMNNKPMGSQKQSQNNTKVKYKYKSKIMFSYYIKMSPFETFFQIMLFYVVLSYIIGPMVFYYLIERSLQSAGNGFIAGSIISIALWIMVGSKMVK